eukprot:2446452-Pleurochrysis_carterae.AAC.2
MVGFTWHGDVLLSLKIHLFDQYKVDAPANLSHLETGVVCHAKSSASRCGARSYAWRLKCQRTVAAANDSLLPHSAILCDVIATCAAILGRRLSQVQPGQPSLCLPPFPPVIGLSVL